jgi:hypothetical protein
MGVFMLESLFLAFTAVSALPVCLYTIVYYARTIYTIARCHRDISDLDTGSCIVSKNAAFAEALLDMFIL